MKGAIKNDGRRVIFVPGITQSDRIVKSVSRARFVPVYSAVHDRGRLQQAAETPRRSRPRRFGSPKSMEKIAMRARDQGLGEPTEVLELADMPEPWDRLRVRC